MGRKEIELLKMIFPEEADKYSSVEEDKILKEYLAKHDYESFVDNSNPELIYGCCSIEECLSLHKLVDAYRKGLITKEEMQKYELKGYPKVELYIKNPKAFKLIEEKKKLNNGVEIIIYSGGMPKDYDLPKGTIYRDYRDFKYEKTDYSYDDETNKIIGKPAIEGYGNKSTNFFRKVKIKLKNGEEIDGMIHETVLKDIDTNKIIPVVVGESRSPVGLEYIYTLVNLENSLSHYVGRRSNYRSQIEDVLADKIFARDNRYIDLNTMQPLRDVDGKQIVGHLCCDFYKGIGVVLYKKESKYRTAYNYMEAYNTKGELIDKIWSKSRVDLFGNESVIYENGNFYIFEKDALDFDEDTFECNRENTKELIQPYIKEDEVNPM